MNGNKKNMGSDIFGVVGDAPDSSPQKGAGTQRNSSNIFGADDPAPAGVDPPSMSADTKGNIFGGIEDEAPASPAAGKANPPTGKRAVC